MASSSKRPSQVSKMQQQQRVSSLENTYWKERMPRAFKFYLDRLARGFVRVQPSNGHAFATVLMEDLLAKRNEELARLPEESYLQKLKVKVEKRACVCGCRLPTPELENGQADAESVVSICKSCGRTSRQLQTPLPEAAGEGAPPTQDTAVRTDAAPETERTRTPTPAPNLGDFRIQTSSQHVQTAELSFDQGVQVNLGNDRGTQVTPAPEVTPTLQTPGSKQCTESVIIFSPLPAEQVFMSPPLHPPSSLSLPLRPPAAWGTCKDVSRGLGLEDQGPGLDLCLDLCPGCLVDKVEKYAMEELVSEGVLRLGGGAAPSQGQPPPPSSSSWGVPQCTPQPLPCTSCLVREAEQLARAELKSASSTTPLVCRACANPSIITASFDALPRAPHNSRTQFTQISLGNEVATQMSGDNISLGIRPPAQSPAAGSDKCRACGVHRAVCPKCSDDVSLPPPSPSTMVGHSPDSRANKFTGPSSEMSTQVSLGYYMYVPLGETQTPTPTPTPTPTLRGSSPRATQCPKCGKRPAEKCGLCGENAPGNCPTCGKRRNEKTSPNSAKCRSPSPEPFAILSPMPVRGTGVVTAAAAPDIRSPSQTSNTSNHCRSPSPEPFAILSPMPVRGTGVVTAAAAPDIRSPSQTSNTSNHCRSPSPEPFAILSPMPVNGTGVSVRSCGVSPLREEEREVPIQRPASYQFVLAEGSSQFSPQSNEGGGFRPVSGPVPVSLPACSLCSSDAERRRNLAVSTPGQQREMSKAVPSAPHHFRPIAEPSTPQNPAAGITTHMIEAEELGSYYHPSPTSCELPGRTTIAQGQKHQRSISTPTPTSVNPYVNHQPCDHVWRPAPMPSCLPSGGGGGIGGGGFDPTRSPLAGTVSPLAGGGVVDNHSQNQLGYCPHCDGPTSPTSRERRGQSELQQPPPSTGSYPGHRVTPSLLNSPAPFLDPYGQGFPLQWSPHVPSPCCQLCDGVVGNPVMAVSPQGYTPHCPHGTTISPSSLSCCLLRHYAGTLQMPPPPSPCSPSPRPQLEVVGGGGEEQPVVAQGVVGVTPQRRSPEGCPLCASKNKDQPIQSHEMQTQYLPSAGTQTQDQVDDLAIQRLTECCILGAVSSMGPPLPTAPDLADAHSLVGQPPAFQPQEALCECGGGKDYISLNDLPDNVSRTVSPGDALERRGGGGQSQTPPPINVNVNVEVDSTFDSNLFMQQVKQQISAAMDQVMVFQKQTLEFQRKCLSSDQQVLQELQEAANVASAAKMIAPPPLPPPPSPCLAFPPPSPVKGEDGRGRVTTPPEELSVPSGMLMMMAHSPLPQPGVTIASSHASLVDY